MLRKQFGANGVGLRVKRTLDVDPLRTASRRLSNRICCYISSELWKGGQSLLFCSLAVFQGVFRWLNNGVHLCVGLSVGQRTMQEFEVFTLRKNDKKHLFFSQASERARILNPRIWLANHFLEKKRCDLFCYCFSYLFNASTRPFFLPYPLPSHVKYYLNC